jgi:hypothetical protein
MSSEGVAGNIRRIPGPVTASPVTAVAAPISRKSGRRGQRASLGLMVRGFELHERGIQAYVLVQAVPE